MNLLSLIAPEQSAHASMIDALHALVFGPGANTRAAFRLREQGPHDINVSFVALADEEVIGSVRMTPVTCSANHRGYLLGPLAVSPKWQNAGLGRTLVEQAVNAAKRQDNVQFVILVGDSPYYMPLGFKVAKPGRVSLPGPVDPRRLLIQGVDGFDADEVCGMIKHTGI
ncbi:MAG: N-acetyltransferase [Pseudomonadota bacterium]